MEDFGLLQALDPTLTVNSKKTYIVERSGTQVLPTQQTVSGSANLSTFTFNFQTTSKQAFIDRNMMLQTTIDYTFAGTSSSGNLIVSGCDAPRSFSLNNNMTSVTCTIDGVQVGVSNSDKVFDAISRYNLSSEARRKYCGLTPSAPDTSQTYEQLFGGVRSPLNEYNNSPEMLEARGSYMTIVSNSPTAAVVRVTYCEPIGLVSPFSFSNVSGEMGLTNVSQFQFTFNFGDFSKQWSHDSTNGNNITSVTPALYENPVLLLTYIQPPESFVPKFPIIYPYYKLQVFPQSNVTIASGSSSQVSCQQLQLDNIPNHLYIFAQKSSKLITDPDAYALITGVSIQFGNKSGVLATASMRQLYNIAVRNGYSGSFLQWSKYNGSVLKLDLARDFGLTELQCPGKRAQTTFLIQVTFQNIHPSSSITFTPYVVVNNEGTFNIDKNQITTHLGILDDKDILSAPVDPNAKFIEVQDKQGGDLIMAAKKLLPLLSSAYSLGKEVLPHVEGYLTGNIPKALSGSGFTEKDGGKLIPRSELAKRLGKK